MDLEFWLAWLPTLNASLNGITTCFLIGAFIAIKHHQELLHKRLMLSALGFSTIFLGCYLIYHFQVGSIPFEGQGWIRILYFCILIPHIILAGVVLPLIGLAVYHALKNHRQTHVKLVHWTYPIWLYVSVSGVLVYLLLYKLPITP